MRGLIFTAMTSMAALATLAPAGASAEPERGRCGGLRPTIVGTAGSDRINSGDVDGGRVVILLSGGSDYVTLGGDTGKIGRLYICGGDGADRISLRDSLDAFEIYIQGNEGADLVEGPEGAERTIRGGMEIYGGAGRDNLSGSSSPDVIEGGPGGDRIVGRDSRDFLAGDEGNDRVFGYGGSDKLTGGRGDDHLDGDTDGYGRGKDQAVGGRGTDRCEAELERECER